MIVLLLSAYTGPCWGWFGHVSALSHAALLHVLGSVFWPSDV